MHKQLYFKHLNFRVPKLTWTVVCDLAGTVSDNSVIQVRLCCWSPLVISQDRRMKVQQRLPAFQEIMKVADVTIKSFCFGGFGGGVGVFLLV